MPVLVEAFRNGEDIHTRTAAEVFGIPPLMITPEQRRNAKAVNFGIVYGQTPFGLAAQLGIERKEAELTSARISSATPACGDSSTPPSPRCAAAAWR